MAAVEGDAQIWRDDDSSRTCSGRFKKRHLIAVGAFAGAAALVIGLSVGLADNASNKSSRAVGQAADEAALGCFNDKREFRVLSDVLTDEALTPAVGVVSFCCACSHSVLSSH